MAYEEIPDAVIKSVLDYKPEDVKWLWPGRFPAGMLSILVGDPGRGKSYFTIDLACRIKAGLPLPDTGEPSPIQGHSLFMVCEDTGNVLRKRQVDMGHDGIDFDVFEGFRRDGYESILNLETDIAALDHLLSKGKYRVVLIDPLMSALGSLDSYNDGIMRSKVLGPLSKLAAKYDVSIILITHLNKKVGISSMYRVGGTIGFVAAARSVLEALTDYSGPDECTGCATIIRSIKNNLGRAADPIGIGVGDGGTFHYYEIEEEKREKLSSGSGTLTPRRAPKLSKAKALWESLLEGGPKPIRGLTANLHKKHRLSVPTLDRARRELGVVIVPISGINHYRLPQEDDK